MEKTELPPPPTVDENYRFYVFFSATNVVVPLAYFKTMNGLIDAYYWLFGLSPGITMYIGMPATFFMIAVILLASCWLIKRFREHRKLLVFMLVANVLAIALTGNPSFLLSLADIPSWTITYINIINIINS